MNNQLLEGIVCSIEAPGIQGAIEQILRQIRQRKPRDYDRLASRILEIMWLSREDEAKGIKGGWRSRGEIEPPDVIPDFVIADERELETNRKLRQQYQEGLRGVIGLARACSSLARWQIIALVAHEFGHACTNYEDIEPRNSPYFDGFDADEWSLELCADMYAYRWGFGREMRRAISSRDPIHHLTGPGGIIQIDDRLYRISRHFVCHPAGRADSQS